MKRIPYEQNYYPPMPSRFTLFMRTNLLWQLFRFAVINIKMLLIVHKH